MGLDSRPALPYRSSRVEPMKATDVSHEPSPALARKPVPASVTDYYAIIGRIVRFMRANPNGVTPDMLAAELGVTKRRASARLSQLTEYRVLRREQSIGYDGCGPAPYRYFDRRIL